VPVRGDHSEGLGHREKLGGWGKKKTRNGKTPLEEILFGILPERGGVKKQQLVRKKKRTISPGAGLGKGGGSYRHGKKKRGGSGGKSGGHREKE